MSDVTVRQLANVLALPVDKLLEQLAEAGMKFDGPDQIVSSTEKVKLLGFLRRTHGKRETPVEEEAGGPKQITLRRKKVSEITVSSGAAKGKTVAVEVRQKRTYVKRSVVEDEQQGHAPDAERERAAALLKESEDRRAAEEVALHGKDAALRQRDEDAKRAEQDRVRAEENRRREEQEAAERAAREAAAPQPTAPPTPAAAPAAPHRGAPSGERAPEGRPGDRPIAGEIRIAEKVRREAPKPAPHARKPETRVPDRDEKHRHKGVHGSHQMQITTVTEDDAAAPAGGRYARGELHLAEPGSAARRAKKKPRPQQRHESRQNQSGGPHGFSRPTEKQVKEIPIGDSINVGELAQKMAVKGAEVVKALFKMGVMVTINQVIDHDTAALVVEELGHQPVRARDTDAEAELQALAGRTADVATGTRPPVVTIMGHVDHGKTSLLDYIRRTKVAAGEAGGITQHIGAYHVETPQGVITFLDTPGHAAFTQMRARGAKLTDIVVLVVAADDGVMPQTIEAVQHAKAANVPLIVAVNKMDKPGADPNMVKQGLIQHEVVPEEFGGEVIFVPVSAKTGAGVDDLLNAITLQAEVMELRAPEEGRATGVVIESSLDKGRGPVATVLVQAGTLNRGDFLVCGVQYGRVRAMFDEAGQPVQSAGPSIPVVALGLSGVPNAGDDFVVVADERLAKEVAQQREAKNRESRLVRTTTRMEDVMSQMAQTGEAQRTLNIVVKADVQGSAQALKDALEKISTDAIRVNVIGSGVGGITEGDATLAMTSKALVIGFNVRTDASARKIVNEAGLDVRYFSIIYDVIDQVRQIATGLLGTEIREEIIGVAQVRDVFRSSKFGQIAGCMVIEGTVRRNKPIRVLRENVVVFQGELESLRRFKEAVEEVRSGMECGIGVKQYNDVKAGDQIECFERIEVARVL